jgi:hypothetical protein
MASHGGTSDGSMASISGGGGARDEEEEEISGGGVGARVQEEEWPKLALAPTTRRGYRSPSVRRPKLVILSFARGTERDP